MDADTQHYSDNELVGLSLRGPRYFAVLVDRFEAPLARYIGRLGRFSPEDIEDILQNIFLKLYENLNGFDTDLKFSSWAYRIAHNEAISYYRRAAARPEGYQVALPDEIIENVLAETNVEHEVSTIEATKYLLQALEELPVHYREIIILRYFEYKEYDEISDILELPPGTVAIRLKRGKERLKKLLERHGHN